MSDFDDKDFDPINNTPIEFHVVDEDGEYVLTTNSLNEASDRACEDDYKVIAHDSMGFKKLIRESRFEKADAEQRELFEEIQEKAQINIVTCGNCSGVIFHRRVEIEEIYCPHCNEIGDPCDFPDLYF